MRKSIIYPRIRSFAISSLALCSLMLFNSTANSEEFIIYRAYFNIGLAHIFPAEARFIDAKKAGSGLPALYGNPNRFSDGEFTGAQLRVGVGYRFSESLRAQLEFATAGNLDFKGNTNYTRCGRSSTFDSETGNAATLIIRILRFPAEWKVISDLRIRSYLGAGMGYNNYRLKDFVQYFPEPENRNGYLRRGANGEIPFTRLPEGSGQEFTYMLTTGVVIPVTKRMKLDLSYRYTDAGEIRTDVGDITIVRYGEDGSRRESPPVKIDETVADFKTYALLATLRFEF